MPSIWPIRRLRWSLRYAPGNKLVWGSGNLQFQHGQVEHGRSDALGAEWAEAGDVSAHGGTGVLLLVAALRQRSGGAAVLREPDWDVSLFRRQDDQERERVGVRGPVGVDQEVLSLRHGAAERDAEWDGEVYGVFEGCGERERLCGESVYAAGDGEVFDGGPISGKQRRGGRLP